MFVSVIGSESSMPMAMPCGMSHVAVELALLGRELLIEALVSDLT